MQFDSFSAFLDMGGYGFYVWLSFGAAFGLLVLLFVISRSANQSTKQQIASQIKREQKLKLAAEQQQAHQAQEVSNES